MFFNLGEEVFNIKMTFIRLCGAEWLSGKKPHIPFIVVGPGSSGEAKGDIWVFGSGYQK